MAARKRRPRRQRPLLRARLVEAPVSSTKTSFVGSRSSCPANHSRRRLRTSARCCSSACAVFLKVMLRRGPRPRSSRGPSTSARTRRRGRLLTRMAEACCIASLGQLAWTADWHIREETYALALRCLVNQQQREPFSAIFGSGAASSSDGQFFQASGFGRAASRLNAHYGQQSGFKVYTHLSDRYGFTKLIAATASEALHVLDALLYHQSEVSIRRHHTD